MNFYEQVGTPLVNPDDVQPELTPEEMVLPTRAQLEERQAKEGNKDDTAASGADTGDGSDKGSDGSGVPGSGDGKNKDSGSEKGGEAEAEDADAVLAGAEDSEAFQATLEDPGEYTPKDYSFEVTVYDAEGKHPKSVKITSPEQFDQLLNEDNNFGNPADLLKAQRLVTKMENASERDKAEYDKQKEAYKAQQAEVEQQNAAVNQMAAELNYLVSKGKLPAVPKKYLNADWSNPEVAKQTGVKEQVELLTYMRKENTERRKLGLADLTPSTAFTEMRAEQAEAKLKQSADQAGEARRAASARVAGVSPAPASAAPKGVSVGRSLGSLDNLSNML